MRLAICGATGSVGTALVARALAGGHTVTALLSAGMDAQGMRRLVVLSSPAVTDLADRAGLFYRARALLRLVMPAVVGDHRAQAQLIEETTLDWTVVRGPRISAWG